MAIKKLIMMWLIFFLMGPPELVVAAKDCQFSPTLKKYKLKRVARDLARSLATDDKRVMVVMRHSFKAPGLPGKTKCWMDKMGWKNIEGTKAKSCSKEHHELNRNAWVYAKKYNQSLMKKLQINTVQFCAK